jgi:site-specific recombinase XerD
VLSGLYTWLASDEIGLVKTNIVKCVPPPKLIKTVIEPLSQDQIKQFLAAADRTHTPRRTRAIIHFLLDSGVRATEAAKIQLSNVDLESGRVKVLGKGNKERFVYIGRKACSILWLYVHQERPKPARSTDDHLFLTHDGYPMNRDSIRHLMCRLSKWCGVKANPHLFRHTAAIERLRNGMNAFSLQRFLGHETMEMTRKYLTALADEDIEVQAQRTSPGDNWRL